MSKSIQACTKGPRRRRLTTLLPCISCCKRYIYVYMYTPNNVSMLSTMICRRVPKLSSVQSQLWSVIRIQLHRSQPMGKPRPTNSLETQRRSCQMPGCLPPTYLDSLFHLKTNHDIFHLLSHFFRIEVKWLDLASFHSSQNQMMLDTV